MFVFGGSIWCRGPWPFEAPLVAAVLVVEVLRQLLDHLELPGLVLVVAVTNSRLDDIFVHRARRREAEVALRQLLQSCAKSTLAAHLVFFLASLRYRLYTEGVMLIL